MKKLNFAICDLETVYACRLMNYITEKQRIPFEMLVFSGVESLREFTGKHRVELLLISARMMCEEVRMMDINRIVILSEGEVRPEYVEYPTVYKYQSSDHLVAEVMNYYAADMSEHTPYFMKQKANVIGIYSPVKRCGKTCFALTLGQILAKRQTVLYLNLEEHTAQIFRMGCTLSGRIKGMSSLRYRQLCSILETWHTYHRHILRQI